MVSPYFIPSTLLMTIVCRGLMSVPFAAREGRVIRAIGIRDSGDAVCCVLGSFRLRKRQ